MKKRVLKKALKRPLTKGQKRIRLIILIAIAVTLLIFLPKIIWFTRLMFELIVRKDIMITLSSDKENLFLQHGQSENIEFTISTIANPFCNTKCSYEFSNLGNNDIIDSAEITARTTHSVSKEYTITADETGEGQKLYRFDINCTVEKSFACTTREEPKTRSILITVDYYLTNQEKAIKNETKSQLLELLGKLNQLASDLNGFSTLSAKLNETASIEDISQEVGNANNNLSALNSTLISLKSSWENQEYIQALTQNIQTANQSLSNLQNDSDKISTNLASSISSYNSLIDSLTSIQQNITSFKTINVTNSTAQEINLLIQEFNSAVTSFSQRNTLSGKQILISSLSTDTNSILLLIQSDLANGTDLDYAATEPINSLNISKLYMPQIQIIQITPDFKELFAKCCWQGNCSACCDEACQSDKEKFPIIFLHGHEFNQYSSAEYSLDTFDFMQRRFEKDGYINAGSFLLNKEIEQGVWQRTNLPVSVKVSYYFDVLSMKENSTIIQSKTDSIDTEAIRLKELVDEIKLKTGKDKVIFVTYSMGGLVFRRYLQVFGENDVEKAILIASPNHGVSGIVLTYCYLFGTKEECKDMDENSLFINKLNSGKNPTIPIYNIVGTGCDMDGVTGDGVVKNSSAYLDETSTTKDFTIQGSCDPDHYHLLHSDIINITAYPQTYEILKTALESQS
jgi:hypothetical protein